MKFTKQIAVSALIAATLTFTGCTQDQQNLAVAASHSDGSSRDNYRHHGHDYGQNRNYDYQKGVRQGCNSRYGGWDADYKRCRNR